MVLQKTENIIKTMLSDTILALCRNTLPYEGEFTVEGLLGITLDNKEIFLININETIENEEYAAKKRERVRKEKQQKDDESSSSHDSDVDSPGPSSPKRKKRKRKRSREKEKPSLDMAVEEEQSENASADDSDNEDSKISRTKTENDNDSCSRSSGVNDRIPAVKREEEMEEDNGDNDDDIVFVKEEPRDDSVSYGHYTGPDAQSFGTVDPALGLNQLQDLALQLSGDISQPGPSTMVSIHFIL